MSDLYVTAHAIERYRERVEDLPWREAEERLQSSAVRAAAEFGAPFVRLEGGQRIVVRDGAVVTVLPSEMITARLNRRYDAEGFCG